MRLTRVRNSLALMTPFRCSPGTFMKRGSPAPVPTKIFQKPASRRSCSVAVLPTTKFLTNLPPSRSILPTTSSISAVGQTELGNAVAQHAAEVVKGLEHGDGVAFGRQKIGIDQAGGTGTDHRDRRLVGRLPGADVVFPAVSVDAVFQFELALALGQVPFELADLERQADQFAGALALVFLRADAAGDVGQRVAVLDEFEGFLELALTQKPHHIRECGSPPGSRRPAGR